MKRSRPFLVAVLGVLLAGSVLIPIRAGIIPGIPDLVIDPAAIAKLADQIVKMEAVISNQVSLYNQAITEYKMLKKNLDFFSSKTSWRTTGISILNSSVTNRHGETTGWNAGVNTGGPASAAAWNVAVIPVHVGDFLVRETLGSSAHLAALAGIEILDNAGPNAMLTLAAVRQQQAANTTAINQLETSVLSGDPEDNTEVKQLNLLNASQLQAMRVQQGAVAVQSELLQQILVSNMHQRNQSISSLNNYSRTLHYIQTEPTGTGNVGEALMTYEPR